ncbi:MAG: hypothetical protein ACD_3C00001G0013 [uncultured bacterium (gcode 4)]|uniref:Uncharacterized protein n=1 Tax=uncultured bacterium (gcode 4) TaxID=1234023 RepID=K2G3G2_9BACT|nr:MAG: hypothetical protein ACD_3C00001G0013 [uncultured bacterium (gcode 4)]
METETTTLTKSQAYLNFAAEYLETIVQYSKKVSIVHGPSHPETHDVHRLVLTLIEDISKSEKESKIDNLPIQESLKALKELTAWFTVPSWACWTFERLYQMLNDFDSVSSEFIGE